MEQLHLGMVRLYMKNGKAIKVIKLLKVKEILATRGIKVVRQTLYRHAKLGLIPSAHKLGQCWYMNEDAAINYIINFKKIGNRGGDRKGWRWWSK